MRFSVSFVLLKATIAFAVLAVTNSGFSFQQDAQKSPAAQSELKSNEASYLTPKQQIKAEIVRIGRKYKLPSMFAGYQTIGKPLVMVAAGQRKNKSGVRVTEDDKVHLGSCTKAITATMLARLIERGKLKNRTLSWDTTIEEGLPDLINEIHGSYAKVTLRQLVMHRGGCPANTNWMVGSNKQSITETRKSLVRTALRKPRDHKPGEFLYSNVGYVVAGLIAEQATDKTWEQLIDEEIFQTLGIESGGFGPPGTPGKIDQPWGHQAIGPLQIPRQGDNPTGLGPAGTIHMSFADWAKFCLSNVADTEKELTPDQIKAAEKLKLVSLESLKLLHKPLENASDDGKDYASGWRVLQREWGGRVFAHSGSNTLWIAVVWISPDNQSVYMAATNVANAEAGKGLDEIFKTLVRLDKEAKEIKDDK